MKIFGSLLIAIVWTLTAKAVVAGPMDYTLDVSFTNGSLAGTDAQVLLTLDQLNGVGFESFEPLANPPSKLLAFSFNFGGFDFSLANIDFPTPFLVFQDGELINLEYDGRSSGTSQVDVDFIFTTRQSINQVTIDIGTERSTGAIDPDSFRLAVPSQVPTPGTLTLLAFGLFGSWLRRSIGATL